MYLLYNLLLCILYLIYFAYVYLFVFCCSLLTLEKSIILVCIKRLPLILFLLFSSAWIFASILVSVIFKLLCFRVEAYFKKLGSVPFHIKNRNDLYRWLAANFYISESFFKKDVYWDDLCQFITFWLSLINDQVRIWS